MASPVLNIKIFTKSRAHTLRAISIITFPPAFLLLLISGITSGRVNPAISTIPLFFSSGFGVFLLANEKKCGCQSSGLTGTPIHLVIDLLIGIGLLVCLILTWVLLPQSAYDINKRDVMLGTYCTNFLIANFLVHLYFTTLQLYDAVNPGQNYPTSCPQCQYGPFTHHVQRATRTGYAPLLDGEGEPSQSAEEERAEVGDDAV